jgi:excisionase family DNA binding protein
MSDRRSGRQRRVLLPRVGGRREADPPEDIDALLAKAEACIDAAQKLVHLAHVARRMSVSDQTVRNWIAEGKIAGAIRTPGGHWRVPLSEVRRLLASL